MCDNSGTSYADDDDQTIVIDLNGMDLGGIGLDGIIDRISLTPDERDKTTKELFGGAPDPKCRWCKGTGKVKLFISESDCDCGA